MSVVYGRLTANQAELMPITFLFLIILVGYCRGKHTVNYGTFEAYEAFVFGNDVIMILIPIFIII